LSILKKDVSTKRWLSGLPLRKVSYAKAFHDEMTSRHLEDRDTYVVDAQAEFMSGEFSFEWIHEDHCDRRSHAVFFEVTYKGHQLQGMVYIPLSNEGGEPIVKVWSIANVDEDEEE
jgi:hypothetical protein